MKGKLYLDPAITGLYKEILRILQHPQKGKILLLLEIEREFNRILSDEIHDPNALLTALALYRPKRKRRRLGDYVAMSDALYRERKEFCMAHPEIARQIRFESALRRAEYERKKHR